MSPDGRFAYVTHILSRYQVPTTQLERGWMNTNALSILDLVEGDPVQHRAARRRGSRCRQSLGRGPLTRTAGSSA